LRPGGRAGASVATAAVSRVLQVFMIRSCSADMGRDAIEFATIGMSEHVIEVLASGIVYYFAALCDGTIWSSCWAAVPRSVDPRVVGECAAGCEDERRLKAGAGVEVAVAVQGCRAGAGGEPKSQTTNVTSLGNPTVNALCTNFLIMYTHNNMDRPEWGPVSPEKCIYVLGQSRDIDAPQAMFEQTTSTWAGKSIKNPGKATDSIGIYALCSFE
jgi:hypothetical protein